MIVEIKHLKNDDYKSAWIKNVKVCFLRENTEFTLEPEYKIIPFINIVQPVDMWMGEDSIKEYIVARIENFIIRITDDKTCC